MKKWALMVDEELFELYDETFFEEEEYGDSNPSEVLREALLSGKLFLGSGITLTEEYGAVTLHVAAESVPEKMMVKAVSDMFQGLLETDYVLDYVSENITTE